MWRHTGIGRYVSNLVPRLAQEVALVTWVAPGDEDAARAAWPGVEVQPCPAPLFSLAEQAFWHATLPRAGLRLFHAPHLNAPLWPGVRLVATVHDLIPLHHPGTTRRRLGTAYVRAMAHLVPRIARRILTHSQATRNDLVTRCGLDPTRVCVVPLAAAPGFFDAPGEGAIKAVRTRFGIPGPFVLYTGQWKRYKNLETLIAAFARVRDDHPDARLVLAGREDADAPHVPGAIAAHGLDRDVVKTGEVDDETLRALYGAATAFAFPSRMEGFGLPPLEAMAAGTPVVCSDAPSLDEAVGDAAWRVPVEEAGAWANALSALLAQPPLRAAWAERGRTQAFLRSWDDVARDTLQAYRDAW